MTEELFPNIPVDELSRVLQSIEVTGEPTAPDPAINAEYDDIFGRHAVLRTEYSKLKDESVKAVYNEGVEAMEQGDTSVAISKFRLVTVYGYVPAYVNLGLCEMHDGLQGRVRAKKTFNEALKILDVSRSVDPSGANHLVSKPTENQLEYQRAAIYYNLASIAYDEGHMAEATDYIDRSIVAMERFGPEQHVLLARRYLVKAALLERTGESKEAREWFDRAIGTSPNWTATYSQMVKDYKELAILQIAR